MSWKDLLYCDFTLTASDWLFLLAAILAAAIFYRTLDRLLRSVFVENVRDKYVLITGCDTGFGRIAALRLDVLGCHVIAACYTEKGCEELRKQASPRLHTVVMDVTDQGSIDKACAAVREILPAGKGLWGLVNNAGVLGTTGPVEWQDISDFKNTFAVNVFGMLRATKTFLPLVKQAKGRIVNTASVLGAFTIPYTVPYSMSKHAVESFSDGLRRELKPFGISVHIIEPGTHKTPFLDQQRVAGCVDVLWQKQAKHIRHEYGEDFFEHVVFLGTKVMPLIGSSDLNQVPAAYENALFSTWPRRRYRIGADTWLFTIFSVFPDSAVDWVFTLPWLRNIPASCKKS